MPAGVEVEVARDMIFYLKNRNEKTHCGCKLKKAIGLPVSRKHR
jgi:hypothetical protein